MLLLFNRQSGGSGISPLTVSVADDLNNWLDAQAQSLDGTELELTVSVSDDLNNWLDKVIFPVEFLDTALAGTSNTALAYTVSANSNRYLLVAISQEGTSAAQPSAVTYGDAAMTLISQLQVGSGTTKCRFDLYELKEAGIAAAVGDGISVTGAPVNVTTIHACSYKNVNQTTPIGTPDTDGIDASTPNPLTGVSIVAIKDNIVMSFSAQGNFGAASWAGVTERTDLATAGGSAQASYADIKVSVDGTIDPRCTWTSQNRAVQVGVEILKVSQ